MSDIIIKDLSFSYGKNEIFQNANFSYCRKDFLSIIGNNGIGKSTLLKLILGFLKPNSGEIILNEKLISYVPQEININKNLPISAFDVVLMGRIKKRIFDFYTKEDKKLAMKFLDLVNMTEYKKYKFSDLSGGLKQRIFIARALCFDAKILLLDEPTANIDYKMQEEIYNILQNLNKNGIGVIAINHNLDISLKYSSKLLKIEEKKIIVKENR